jgi:hypothetical protein
MANKSLFSRLFHRASPDADPVLDTADESPPPAAEAKPQPAEPRPAEPQPAEPHPEPAPATAAPGRARRAAAVASVAPVFIIGYAPDASILLTRCLTAHTGLAGHEEGLLLPLLLQLHRAVTHFFRTGLAAAGPDALIRHVDPVAFHHPIRRAFIDLMAAHHAGADWVDNTQGLAGIQAAPMLRTLWPRARFIFLASRVLESIAAGASPAGPREQAIAWARGMEQWRENSRKFGADCLTLDRHTLLSAPEAAAAEVATFLKLDSSQAAALTSAWSGLVREAGGFGTPLTASERPEWSGQDGEALRAASAPIMAMYGYSWDETYFRGTQGREDAAD